MSQKCQKPWTTYDEDDYCDNNDDVNDNGNNDDVERVKAIMMILMIMAIMMMSMVKAIMTDLSVSAAKPSVVFLNLTEPNTPGGR